MQARKAATIKVQQHAAGAQYLARLAFVITHISALPHDGIHQVIPARGKDPLWAGEAMTNEGMEGVARDRLGDSLAEQQAGEKPKKQVPLPASPQIEPELLRIERCAPQAAGLRQGNGAAAWGARCAPADVLDRARLRYDGRTGGS